MATIDQIGDLWEKIAVLDTKAKELRRESNENVAFVPDENGQPKQIVNDPDRFQQIGGELQNVAAQRAATVDKLSRIKDILGENADGCLAGLSGEDALKQATRLRFEHANKMHILMCNYKAALTPTELEKVPEYQSLRDRCLPEIARLEECARQDRQLAAQVYAILRA
jgi:hypothetical protein